MKAIYFKAARVVRHLKEYTVGLYKIRPSLRESGCAEQLVPSSSSDYPTRIIKVVRRLLAGARIPIQCSPQHVGRQISRARQYYSILAYPVWLVMRQL